MTDVAKKADEVTLTIDGVEVTAPKGTLLIRVAEQLGIAIPRFCDHPLLAPAGACRQCLVEVEGQRKPVASCTQAVADGMVVKTQLSSPVAKKAQEGIMELLLINHPLDCPMCDKGGECPLQNQAMSTGRADSRFHEHKREYPKPINISSQVLLDRERCVLCQRCTRFSEEIAGDKFIDLMNRSSNEEINVYRDEVYDADAGEESEGDVPFNSYFSGNTVQICPVGALTGAQYRFRSPPVRPRVEPVDVRALRLRLQPAHRPPPRQGAAPAGRRRPGGQRGVELRQGSLGLPLRDRQRPAHHAAGPRRGQRRTARGVLERGDAASLPRGCATARDGAHGVGVLTGGRLTVEDAYAYAKFARVALGTNDIDFRSRPLSAEETEFLASSVVGTTDVTYADVDAAPAVVIVGLEPEEESPILFLRLRKQFTKRKLPIYALSPYVTRGLEKLGAKVARIIPGEEARVLAEHDVVAEALKAPGALLIVGERLASVPGGLSAAAALAERTGAKLAWVPRRAGDRGAVDAGCLPNLLPGGRLAADAAARAELAGAWDLAAGVIPSQPGRDTDAMLVAAAGGRLGALVVAGVDPADLSDPKLAEQALDAVPFLVSLEVRLSAVSRRANVVFPVAPVAEKAGSFLDWEGRLRTFETVLTTEAMNDGRVLDALAAALGVTLGTGDVNTVRRELGGLPVTRADRPHAPAHEPADVVEPGDGEAVLATWHQLIDLGSLLDGDQELAGTARPPAVRLDKATAEAIGVADGEAVTVGTGRGAVTLPAMITDMPAGVVWLPTNSPGSTTRRTLGVTSGAVVSISAGGAR